MRLARPSILPRTVRTTTSKRGCMKWITNFYITLSARAPADPPQPMVVTVATNYAWMMVMACNVAWWLEPLKWDRCDAPLKLIQKISEFHRSDHPSIQSSVISINVNDRFARMSYHFELLTFPTIIPSATTILLTSLPLPYVPPNPAGVWRLESTVCKRRHSETFCCQSTKTKKRASVILFYTTLLPFLHHREKRNINRSGSETGSAGPCNLSATVESEWSYGKTARKAGKRATPVKISVGHPVCLYCVSRLPWSVGIATGRDADQLTLCTSFTLQACCFVPKRMGTPLCRLRFCCVGTLPAHEGDYHRGPNYWSWCGSDDGGTAWENWMKWRSSGCDPRVWGGRVFFFHIPSNSLPWTLLKERQA